MGSNINWRFTGKPQKQIINGNFHISSAKEKQRSESVKIEFETWPKLKDPTNLTINYTTPAGNSSSLNVQLDILTDSSSTDLYIQADWYLGQWQEQTY